VAEPSITTLPAEQRRGCWEDDCGNTWEAILLEGNAEDVARALQKESSIGLIECDVTKQVLADECPVPDGRWALLVKLRGTNWVHLADPSQLNPFTRDYQLAERLAEGSGLRVLQTGYQDTASATYVIVRAGKDRELLFESTGAGFGGDPLEDFDLEDELEQDELGDIEDEFEEDYEDYENEFHITKLESSKYPADWWKQYPSEAEVQQALLRDLEAYVPFIQAYPGAGTISIAACHEDAVSPANIERIDLVIFGAAASATPNPASRQLAEAIAAGDLAGVEAALAAGANLQALPDISDSALLYAISRLSPKSPDGAKIVAALLTAGASPSEASAKSSSPLIEAVSKCESCLDQALEVVTLLIDAGADMNHARPMTFFGGGTALHEAVQHRSLSAVMLLHQRGADLSVTDGVGSTPLARAETLLTSASSAMSLFGQSGEEASQAAASNTEKPIQEIIDYLKLAASGQAIPDWQTQAAQERARFDSQRRRMLVGGERVKRAMEQLGQQLDAMDSVPEDAVRQAVMALPDTIHLSAVDEDAAGTLTEDQAQATQELLELGFEDIADYAVEEMPGVLIRALIHHDQHVYAAVCRSGEVHWIDLVRFRPDGSALTVTNAAIEPGIDQLSKGTPYDKKYAPGANAKQLYEQEIAMPRASRPSNSSSDSSPTTPTIWRQRRRNSADGNPDVGRGALRQAAGGQQAWSERDRTYSLLELERACTAVIGILGERIVRRRLGFRLRIGSKGTFRLFAAEGIRIVGGLVKRTLLGGLRRLGGLFGRFGTFFCGSSRVRGVALCRSYGSCVDQRRVRTNLVQALHQAGFADEVQPIGRGIHDGRGLGTRTHATKGHAALGIKHHQVAHAIQPVNAIATDAEQLPHAGCPP
jgi:hypothetical protein